jgi:hypothetical protein
VSAGHLLGTVVVSELRQTQQAGVSASSSYLSAITLLEIRQAIRQVAERDPAFAGRLEH